MLPYNFGTHESLKIYHWFRHLSFRRTSQLIVTFIRPFINFNKGLSFLIQLLESKERPWIVPLEILVLSTGMIRLSRRNHENGIASLNLILLGFLRHVKGAWIIGREFGGAGHPTPPGALFNAPHIRLSLGWLLPSRASLRFTGHLIHHLYSAKIWGSIVPPEVSASKVHTELSDLNR